MTESRFPPISNFPHSRFVKYVDALLRRVAARSIKSREATTRSKRAATVLESLHPWQKKIISS